MMYVLLLLLLRCGAPTKEYTYPYSLMHRGLNAAGIEVALITNFTFNSNNVTVLP